MSTATAGHHFTTVSPVRAAATTKRHLAWLGAGLVTGFAVPFLLADVAGLQRDVYYGLYAVAVLALLSGWMRDTGQSPPDLLRRRWRLAAALGLLFAAVSVAIALGQDATGHPDGLEFAGAILWRGLMYGAIDGLLLSAFPILVVAAALSATKLPRPAVLAAALAASLLMTATYHLGYSDFRSDKLRKPVAGDLIWSVPTLATLNPIGAPIAHAGLHVAAVTHSYDTDLFLPPH